MSAFTGPLVLWFELGSSAGTKIALTILELIAKVRNFISNNTIRTHNYLTAGINKGISKSFVHPHSPPVIRAAHCLCSLRPININ